MTLINGRFSVGSCGRHNGGSHRYNLIYYLVFSCIHEQVQSYGKPQLVLFLSHLLYKKDLRKSLVLNDNCQNPT